jgi:hypothetical protein
MARMNRRKGKRRANTLILCEWCGETRECTRADTKTCGDRCRARLSFYIARLGYPPDGLPGKVTAQTAIDREVRRLVLAEKRRRETANAERTAYLNSHDGRKMSGSNAPTTF